MSTTSNVYFSEFERLKTFQNGWPHAFLSPEVMAKCGFYYTGHSDYVKCPFCNVVVLNWSPEDEPIREHIRSSKRCRFINGFDVGNIFIGDDPRVIYHLMPGEDVFGSTISKNATSAPKHIDSDDFGTPYCEPRFLDQITYDSRLASFKDWTSENITPAKLAEAGFFFRGVCTVEGIEIVDAVTCFHCGESLSGWTKDDNAWEEHAKFSPKCSFIFLLTAFEVSERYRNVASPTLLPYSWLSKATDDNRCAVCFDFSLSISFNPCGHSTCAICAASLTKCPLCRSNIKCLTKISKEIPAIEPSTEASSAEESLTVESSASSSAVESPIVESKSIKLNVTESPKELTTILKEQTEESASEDEMPEMKKVEQKQSAIEQPEKQSLQPQPQPQ